MAESTHGDMLRARVTVTVEMPAVEASMDQIRTAITRSLITNRAEDEPQIVSVDAVELIESGIHATAPKQPVNRNGRSFRDTATLEQLIAEQGVTPIQDIDELVGDFWPEDEGPDDFVNWLHEERRHR